MMMMIYAVCPCLILILKFFALMFICRMIGMNIMTATPNSSCSWSILNDLTERNLDWHILLGSDFDVDFSRNQRHTTY